MPNAWKAANSRENLADSENPCCRQVARLPSAGGGVSADRYATSREDGKRASPLRQPPVASYPDAKDSGRVALRDSGSRRDQRWQQFIERGNRAVGGAQLLADKLAGSFTQRLAQ